MSFAGDSDGSGVKLRGGGSRSVGGCSGSGRCFGCVVVVVVVEVEVRWWWGEEQRGVGRGRPDMRGAARGAAMATQVWTPFSFRIRD